MEELTELQDVGNLYNNQEPFVRPTILMLFDFHLGGILVQ